MTIPKADDPDAAPGANPPGLLSRLLSGKAAVLLARNTVVSCSVFALGIALLWAMVQLLGMAKFPAVAISFLVSNSIHYAFSRIWIFAGTKRARGAGYVYFFVNAGVGLIVTLALFWLFTELFAMHYLVARMVASVFAGLSSFVLNAVLNFRSV